MEHSVMILGMFSAVLKRMKHKQDIIMLLWWYSVRINWQSTFCPLVYHHVTSNRKV